MSPAISWNGVFPAVTTQFREDFSLDTDAYGSIYYLITGFHGLHVLGGLVLMLAVAGLVLGRDSEAPIGPSVAVTGYYWHFVDLVWIFVFGTLYLLR